MVCRNFGRGFNSRQPIMIGQCQDGTSNNRKLAVSAGHRPDGEGTKKDTQRSRGSGVT